MVDDSPPLAHVAHSELTATVGVRDGALRLDVREGEALRLGVTLGVTVGGVDLDATSRFVRSSERTVIEEIAPISGKSTTPAARVHRELRLIFEAETGIEWETVIRLAEDGAAVRYSIPDLQGVSRLDGEATALHLAPFDRVWLSIPPVIAIR